MTHASPRRKSVIFVTTTLLSILVPGLGGHRLPLAAIRLMYVRSLQPLSQHITCLSLYRLRHSLLPPPPPPPPPPFPPFMYVLHINNTNKIKKPDVEQNKKNV
ncbi:hypothetical protein E2C01_087992 [Portunus trituberculatus]|uniref:Uncharacterized protein n=1 Tax=Portunus trituberculatus TaxID=210409 RepID=A0A5B7JDA7_PORTR|nr:hypothetical protein [Portunus trituberculatus]